MQQFLNNLTAPAIIVLGLAFIIGIVIIALNGKVSFKLGSRIISLGQNRKGRSCSDCVLLIMAEGEKARVEVERIRNNILRSQMVFVEQHLEDIKAFVIDKILKVNLVVSDITYKSLVHEVLDGSFFSIKDEFRRAFKENGFDKIPEDEFNRYVKREIENLKDILAKFIRIMYSSTDKTDEIVKIIKKEDFELNGHIYEIFSYARRVKKESDTKMKKICEDFNKWIDDLVKNQ